MTPIKKIVRKGNRIYVVDLSGQETLIATAAETALDNSNASFVANALAGWHSVPLEEEDSK